MCFDFVDAVKPGDIVFAKRGRRTIVGRGVVTGEYRYDTARTSFHVSAMATAAAKPASFTITEEVKKKLYEASLVIRREALQQNEGRN